MAKAFTVYLSIIDLRTGVHGQATERLTPANRSCPQHLTLSALMDDPDGRCSVLISFSRLRTILFQRCHRRIRPLLTMIHCAYASRRSFTRNRKMRIYKQPLPHKQNKRKDSRIGSMYSCSKCALGHVLEASRRGHRASERAPQQS